MPISIERYVDITSGVAAGASTATRQLIARLFTTSTEIPTNTVLEFSSADSVGSYFGTSSEEYDRAVYYFGFVSKLISSPETISFTRWANVDVGATILGGSVQGTTLAEYQAVTAGAFTITLAGVDGDITALDLSSANDFATVASTVQAAIRLVGGTFAAVEVTYNASRSRFEFDSGNTGDETISVTDGAQTPLALLGWAANASTRLSDGQDAQTPVEVVSETTAETNNFGSFLFQDILTEEQYDSLSSWNQSQNIKFIHIVPVTAATASSLSSALIGYTGTSLELTDDTLDEYPEMLPMAILASTNYSNLNSTVNYMFHEDSRLTSLVKTDTIADTYDALRVNYIGQTQTAGDNISFYQRGVLCGGTTAPVSQNTYANEMWLKDYATSQFMDLFRNLPKISRNNTGKAQGRAVLQGVVNQALTNGTVSVGKTLNTTQRLYVTSQTGDPTAYLQIQNIGYWFNVTFDSETSDDVTTYILVYTLLYSKDDVVRKVEGTHALI